MPFVAEHISSTKNPVVRSFVRLHRPRARRDSGLMLIEGPTVFKAAIDAGATPVTVLATPEDVATPDLVHGLGDVTVHSVTEHVLKAASDTTHPRSPVATFRRPEPSPLRGGNVVVLVDISDPGNVGTIIRTAAALRWDVVVTGHTADVWSPKVLRSSAGTHFSTAIHEAESLEALFVDSQYTVVATIVADGDNTVHAPEPIALLVGSEAHGLADEVLALADTTLTIPMPGGTESLNAAVAAALGMWIAAGQPPTPS